MDALWQIDLLGGLRARGAERTITRFRTHKTGLLLAYLALHPDRAHPRVTLAEMLWPGGDPRAGRLNLRAELASLRRQLEAPTATVGGRPLPGAVLIATNAEIQLNPRAISTDVAAFEATVEEARRAGDAPLRVELLRRAIGQYRGELLPGYFEDWILLERARLADGYLAALRSLSQLLREAGDLEGAIAAAHRAIAADPLSEEAYFDLIRLYAATNRPEDARRQYRELAQALRREIDDEPSEDLRHFAAGLANDSPALHAAHRPEGQGPTTPSPPVGDAGRSENARGADAAGAVGQGLPLPFTRFFGRGAELARLERLLGQGNGCPGSGGEIGIASPAFREPPPDTRLVTLTGSGGSGKTRLALEGARRLGPRFADRVWFVPLADLTDAAAIPAALAAALRLPRSPDLEPLEHVIMALGPQPALMVLDNLEHLLAEGRQLVRQLMEQAPALICLVTSRQRLELEGEREIPVLPLPVPEQGAGCRVWGVGSDEGTPAGPYPLHPTPYTLLQCPSVQLFVDRAQAVRPDFQVTPRNAAAVVALCARLEGVPLAIELAAAWAQTLTPAQMVAQAESGSSVLVSRRKDVAPRHRSLHAAIDWSYCLLEPALQRFFARLAVFRGGWDLEAARSVCAEPEGLTRIAALRDRSLAVAEECGETMRYRLLESVREYARERLNETEWEGLVRWHTDYFLALAEAAERQLSGPEQRLWLEKLKADETNLQVALERAGRREEGLRLAAALSSFWQLRGQWREGDQWLERTLSANPEAPPALRARALFGAAALAYLAGDSARGESLCEAGLLLCDLLPSSASTAAAIRPLLTPNLLLICCGPSGGQPRLLAAVARGGEEPRAQAFLIASEAKQAQFGGDYAAAAALHDRSLAIYRQRGEQRGTAALLYLRGSALFYQDERAATRGCWVESLALYQELDDQAGICLMTGTLGYADLHLGEHEGAERLLDEALSMSRRMGARAGIAASLWALGKLAYHRQQYDRASLLLEESLEIRRASGEPSAVSDTLVTLGMIANARGDRARARGLLEEAVALRRRATDGLDLADALLRLGYVALAEGQYRECERLLDESLALGRRMQNNLIIGWCLRGLGLAACRQGDLALAGERLGDCLALLSRTTDRQSMAEGVEALAELKAREERAEEAASLYAKAYGIRRTTGALLPPCDRPRRARELASLRAALGPERFAAIWEEARGRSPNDLLLDVLERVS